MCHIYRLFQHTYRVKENNQIIEPDARYKYRGGKIGLQRATNKRLNLMSSVQTYSESLEIFSQTDLDVENAENKFYITAQLHTSKLIPRPILKRYSKTGVNKEVRVFHISPEKDVRSFVGVVDKVWWDDEIDEPMVKVEVYDDTTTARKVRDILTEDMSLPLNQRRFKGISAGIFAQRDKNTKEIVKFHIREVSLARDPVCEECTIQEILTFEKGVKMPDGTDKVIELFEKVKTDLQTTIDSQTDLLDELRGKIERYEKTIVLQENEIERLNTVVSEKDGAIETFEQTIAETEKAVEDAKKEPIIKQILTYEKFDTKKEEGKKRLERLQELNSDALTIMLESFERQRKLAAKGLDVSHQLGGLQPDSPVTEIGQYDNLTPQQRQEVTDKLIDGQGVAGQRQPGDLMGPIDGGF